jgi:hypothetical protein
MSRKRLLGKSTAPAGILQLTGPLETVWVTVTFFKDKVEDYCLPGKIVL